MSGTTMPHPTFSIPLFTQLVRRLRYTNARYDQIAHQCRHTQRPTHHAKRRAYRAGLHIDTFKARAAWHDGHVSTPSIHLSPVLDRTASLVWVATEEDACTPSLRLGLRNLPEVVVQKERLRLSPLGLGLGLNLNTDDSDACDLPFRGPVPGAPRWKSKPLPEDECGMVTEATTLGSVASTYEPVWRDVIATHVSDSVSMPFDVPVVYASLGVTVPPRHLKRKLRDVEMDWSAMFSQQPEVGVRDDGYFLGTCEARRRRGGL